ncbi:MAG: XRE family transcriptional regulator [Clostridiaceae bacterium]
MNIGEKIKNIRLKMGLTQEELAERSDLTKGFISQLERDTTSPSVDTLEKIVRALGTDLAEFFKVSVAEPVVYRLTDACMVNDENLGHIMHFIVPNAQKLDMEPVVLDLTPGGRSRTYTPYEGQSFGFVLAGQIGLNLGSEQLNLMTNDCFYFEMNEACYVENLGEEAAKLLWVLSPPNF